MTGTAYCPHQPECTGCPLSHLPYADQLTHKAEAVRRELARSPITNNLDLRATLGAATTQGYRLRAKLVQDAGRLGLYGEAHAVVDTAECRILHPALQAATNQLRKLLPLACPILAVDIRVADEGLVLTLVVPKGTALETVRAAMETVSNALPEVRGLAYSERDPRSPQVLGGVPIGVLGQKELRHSFGPGHPHHLAVFGGFVQAHTGQANALHDAILDALKVRFGKLAGLPIAELYAGAGALALRLAAAGAQVTAIDSYAPSIGLLQRAAAEQRLSVNAIASNAEAALANLRDARVVIVDPPRRGLSVEVRNAIAAAKPELLVYVSCEPKTLARDLDHFAWLGYRAKSVLPIDMIPQSHAVEALVLLEPAPQPELEIVHRDAELVAVVKPAHLPTTPHDEYANNLVALVQLLPGCEHAAPVHRLDVGTSGVCLFAVEPRFAHQLGQELTAGQKTYVALAQGITHKRGKIKKSLLEGRVAREAETRYTRTGVVGTHSMIHAFPIQGRKHQIRRHLAAVGHPLLGDAKYSKPASARFYFERHGLDRPFLHCVQIELVRAGTPLHLRAPLAADLERVLDSLRQNDAIGGWRDDR